ncbi:MAG: phosphohydrolase [Deltaproteobacteria bacterium]|nr:phosphohydrolase [Deltaproteobacteria bacterium]MBW2017595.1 phosphohydrolase [Deltaproteobacteria bacterium]MBW2304997.1 phosphohydrolase [Deltaproteobacteria bacterium]
MKCPGQDSRYWKPDAIFEARCPKCGESVEFFKDDTTRRCKACGHRFLNPSMDFGCAAYCKYAEQCIGNLPPELIAQKEDLLKDRVAIEVKRHLKRDFKTIGRTTRRARHAEKIGKAEGGNLAVILTAAYLLGLKEEDRRAGARSGTAREILEKLGAPEPLLKEVFRIIDPGENHPDTTEFKCVHDADRITELEDRLKDNNPLRTQNPEDWIQKELKTESGRGLAREILQQ